MMYKVVHIRRFVPGYCDTFMFQRTFNSEKAAENFIHNGGWRTEPDQTHSSSYAVIVN